MSYGPELRFRMAHRADTQEVMPLKQAPLCPGAFPCCRVSASNSYELASRHATAVRVIAGVCPGVFRCVYRLRTVG